MDFLSVSVSSKMKPEPHSALLPHILLAFMSSEIIIFLTEWGGGGWGGGSWL